MPEVHVVPRADLIGHAFGPGDHDDCICGPLVRFVDGGTIVVHYSLDGREAWEREGFVREEEG